MQYQMGRHEWPLVSAVGAANANGLSRSFFLLGAAPPGASCPQEAEVAHWSPQLSNAQYHLQEDLSSTQLRYYLRAPRKYLHSIRHIVKPTPAMVEGSVFHALMADELEADFIVTPEINRRTKEGKAEWAALEAQAEEERKQLIKPEVITKVEPWVEAVLEDPEARELRFGPNKLEPVRVEHSGFFDHHCGQPCRIRPDHLTATHCIDWKTTTDASPDPHTGFPVHARKLGYVFQAAFYRLGLEYLDEKAYTHTFVAVEKTPPHLVHVHHMKDDHLDILAEFVDQAIGRFHEDRMGDRLDQAYGEPSELALPNWMIEQLVDEADLRQLL